MYGGLASSGMVIAAFIIGFLLFVAFCIWLGKGPPNDGSGGNQHWAGGA
jgi:hypothetical protein